MRYIFVFSIISLSTFSLFAETQPNIELWKFPTQYKYMIRQNIQRTPILINLNCKSKKDCVALKPKEKKIKMNKRGGANPVALLCKRNNGKVREGTRKKSSVLFCQFNDGSIIELKAMTLR